MSRFLARTRKLMRALVQPRRQVPLPRRILIAHGLLLGDTLLLAPLLKALAQSAPDAERTVLVRPSALSLFSGRPYGVRALGFDRRSAKSQHQVMDSGPYDLAIVPDDNRYAWLARAAGASWIVGIADDRPGWKNFMLDEAFAYPAEERAWADFLPSLIGAANPLPYASGEWPAPIAKPFTRPAGDYVVLHVGASTELKQWPGERWSAFARELRESGLKIVWSGGAAEKNVLIDIDPPVEETAWFGQLDLAQLWHLLADATALVCPDTGIAHLGRVVGTPTIAMYGPGSVTVHGRGIFWADAQYFALTAPNFPCRDQDVLYRREVKWVQRCGRSIGIGSNRCPNPLCMQAISIDTVKTQMALLLDVTEA